jgi:Flp pilus assembly protein TadG
MRFKSSSRSSRRRLRRDRESGQALVILVVFLPVLIGFAALVLDVGNWYAQKRFVQNAADAAVLAGAQNLPDSSAAQAMAESYVSKNGGGVTNVTFPTSDKIHVVVTRNVPTYFAKLFGLSSVNVAAKATASRFANGPNALLFAKDTDCQAIRIPGNDNTFQGAVVSNGGFTTGKESGEILYYGPPQSCFKPGNGSTWTTIVPPGPGWVPKDWPVPPPDLTTLQSICASQGHVMPAAWTITNSTTLSPGLYCASTSISINASNKTFTNVGLVTPQLSWSSGPDTFTGWDGVFPQYGGLLFYVYGCAPPAALCPGNNKITISATTNTWTGGIFVPYAAASLPGGAGKVLTGYIQAQRVVLPGGGANWIGLGPAIGGSGGVSLTE